MVDAGQSLAFKEIGGGHRAYDGLTLGPGELINAPSWLKLLGNNVYLVLVSWLCRWLCASSEGGYFSDMCFCVSAAGVCDGGIGKLTCHDIVSLWGQTYTCKP